MDFYSDDSDADFDEDLREDLDALRRSCILSGADPDAAVAQVSSSAAAAAAGLAGPSTPGPTAAAGADNGSSSDEEEEEEDLALFRSIRANLHRLNKASPSSPLPDPGGGDEHHPSSPRPICTWPPSDTEDEEEDDLETLRAIQRRFSHYRSGTSAASPKSMKSEAPQVVHSAFFADGPDEEFSAQKQNIKASNKTGFPKAALLLVDALKKNRACQKFIRRKMINIEAKIEENKDLRDRVKCLLGYQLSCRKSVGRFLCQKEDPRVRFISSKKPSQQSPKNKYWKMPALFLGPTDNPYVLKYRMVLKQFPMSLQKQPWSDVEKDKLARGVKQQYQEALILDSMNNGSAIGDFSAVDLAYALTNGAGNFEVTPEGLRSVLPLINWDKISAMYLPGRSGAECEARWINCDDPLINHNAWSSQEETRLLLIIQEKGMCNWINIAATLGTHRTPFQCLTRYQRSLNPHILNKAWTKEEDLQLLAAIETFGHNWQLVSASLDGRCGNQCSNRWRKTLHPERTRVGAWSLDEDKRLMVSVKLFGACRWSRIAQFIPGRTQSQCRDRWYNVLNPDNNLEKWQPEEDAKLLESVSLYGRCWAKIAGVIIPHRNDNMCLRRWKQLCKDELPLVKATSQIKKSIFQSNFVDREKERPAIGPDDFISLIQSKGDGCDKNNIRDNSKKQAEGNLAVSNVVNSSTLPEENIVLNTCTRRSRRISSGGRSKRQTEENVTVLDGLNNSSSGQNRFRKRKSITGNNVAVQKRTRGSISVDNEAIPKELGGTTSADNEVENPFSVGEEAIVVKKRTRRLKPACNDGVVEKRMRGSISPDNNAGTNQMRDPVSGEEAVVKKRESRLKPACSDGIVRKRMRGSISIENHSGPTKRKRASSRKPNKDNLMTDGMVDADPDPEFELPSVSSEETVADAGNKNTGRRKSAPMTDGLANTAPELGFSSVPSEERVADAGNVNKVRRKSTPRPKQIHMSDGAADKHSTFERLVNCLSLTRMNGTNRSNKDN